eukprot:4664871-Karenia_brevis.AAC.1
MGIWKPLKKLPVQSRSLAKHALHAQCVDDFRALNIAEGRIDQCEAQVVSNLTKPGSRPEGPGPGPSSSPSSSNILGA